VLVGRRDALGLLHVRLRGGRPVAVVGEAGIGKTTVLRAAVERYQGASFLGGALSTLGWIPYLPLTRALGDRGLNGDRAAAAAAVREAVGDGLLVLDDLHWADPETLSLLPLLAGQIGLLAAIRQGDPGSSRALAAVEEAGFEQLALDPLEDTDALGLLAGSRPGLEAAGTNRVLAGARGNPLLLLELAADGEASSTLRLSLEARLARCSPEAEEALELLALIGRAAEADLLGSGADELVAAGLATEDAGRVSPRHALIVETAASRLDPERRRELHERLARALVDHGEAARHYEAAGLTDLARALALKAAAATRRPGERAEHLRVAASCSTGPASDRLRLEAVDALLEAGRPAEAQQLADSVQGSGRVTRARVCLARGRALRALEDQQRAVQQYEEGLSLAGDDAPDVTVRLRLELVHVALWSGAPDIEKLARDGLARATAAGTHVALAHYILGCALFYPVGSLEALEHLERSRLLSEQAGDQDFALEAVGALVAALHQVGRDPQAAFRLAEEGRQRAAALKLRARETCFRWLAARLRYLDRGEYSRAIEELHSLLDEPLFGYPSRDQVTADLVLALADVGRIDDARTILARDPLGGSGWWGRQALAEMTAELEIAAGRPERAVAAAEAGLEEAVGSMIHGLSLLRDFARLDLGLAPGPTPVDVPTDAFSEHSGATYEALASFADGRFDTAARLFEEAAEAIASIYQFEELRWRWAAGEAARRGGDLALARRHLLEVEERATAHGLAPLLARTRRSLRLAGERRSMSGPRSSNGSLTLREREVLGHVAGGETSKQIARRLGVSPATVDGVAKSSMAKLGARTRRQAAALASRSADSG
jgi:DNA-binding CsgD family transcriptional regulator